MVHGLETIKKLNDQAVVELEKPLSRQAKIKGSDQWFDMGNVSLRDAAVNFAEIKNLATDKIYVVVRDSEDLVEHELTVESCRAFKVSGLRGGE